MSVTPEGVQQAHTDQPRRDAEQGLREGTRRHDRGTVGDQGAPHLLHVPAAALAGMARLQRSIGNRAVSSLLTPVQQQAVQRQRPTPSPPTPAPPSGAMTRARFVELLSTRYGISTVRAGTFADQQEVNSRPGVSAAGRLTEAAWAAWDPGPTSEIYSSVVTAFDDFESLVGGVPPVGDVLFFATAYTVNAGTHQVEPNPGVGADFGADHLRVYRSGVVSGATGGKGVPVGRSTAAGRYPPVVIGLGGRGTDPGAPIPLPTAGENTVRVITHELGHGLAEQAMAADHAMFEKYRLAVGWTDGRLFDVGIPEVRRALDAGTIPPATIRTNRGGRVTVQPTQITVDSWNHQRWVEQPISAYTVTGGPGEDFAEAVMGFVNARAVLQARSPVRYGFLDSHRASWLPFLRTRPPVGDFLGPSGPGRLA